MNGTLELNCSPVLKVLPLSSNNAVTVMSVVSECIHILIMLTQVKVGKDEYIHLRVHRNLQQVVSLSNFLLGKTLEDPLKYFQ